MIEVGFGRSDWTETERFALETVIELADRLPSAHSAQRAGRLHELRMPLTAIMQTMNLRPFFRPALGGTHWLVESIEALNERIGRLRLMLDAYGNATADELLVMKILNARFISLTQ